MNHLLARLLAFFRGPMQAPPRQLEAKSEPDRGLSPVRLDEALQRLRAQTPLPDEKGGPSAPAAGSDD